MCNLKKNMKALISWREGGRGAESHFFVNQVSQYLL